MTDPRTSDQELHDLLFFGSSDDLLETSGYMEEEFYSADGTITVLVTTPAGARIAITASLGPSDHPLANDGDGWILTFAHTNPSWTYPVQPIARPDSPGDPGLRLSVPVGTTVTEFHS